MKTRLTPQQEAAAELVNSRVRSGRGTTESVIAALCAEGGELCGFCTVPDLTRWVSRMRDVEKQEGRGRELYVDPVEFDGRAAPEVPAFSEQEQTVAGRLLEFVDQRAFNSGKVKWRRTSVAVRDGERYEVRYGPGEERVGNDLISWMAFAVVVIAERGEVRKVVADALPAEQKVTRWRDRKWNRNGGRLIIKRSVMEGPTVNPASAMQALGTLLLLFKGSVAGGAIRSHAEIARLTGMTRANGSATARRMAAKVVAAGNKPSFTVLRRRHTVGKGRKAG